MSGISKIMHCGIREGGILIKMPYCGEVKLWLWGFPSNKHKSQCHSDQVLFNGHNRGKRQTDGSAPDEIGLGVFQWWNIDSGLFTILVQTCQMDVLPKKGF